MSDTGMRKRPAGRLGLYVRLRHRQARLSVEEAARSNLVAYLAHASYLLLESYRADGTPALAQMRFAVVDETIFLRTSPAAGKLRRIAHKPLVRVAACTIRGLPIADHIQCLARVIPPERQADARAALARRYRPWLTLLDWLSRKRYAYLELTPSDRAAPAGRVLCPVIALHAARARSRLPGGAA